MTRDMRVVVKNIPNVQWHDIQNEIFATLLKHGLAVDTVRIEDGVTGQFMGYEFELLEG